MGRCCQMLPNPLFLVGLKAMEKRQRRPESRPVLGRTRPLFSWVSPSSASGISLPRPGPAHCCAREQGGFERKGKGSGAALSPKSRTYRGHVLGMVAVPVTPGMA